MLESGFAVLGETDKVDPHYPFVYPFDQIHVVDLSVSLYIYIDLLFIYLRALELPTAQVSCSSRNIPSINAIFVTGYM